MARRIRGSITVEILISFAVFTLMASAILLVSQSAKDAASATEIQADLMSAAELALAGYEDDELSGRIHSVTHKTHYPAPCLSEHVVDVSHGRYSVERSRMKADMNESMRLGGDCNSYGTDGIGVAHMYPGDANEEGSAVDSLGVYVYLGTTEEPYLRIFVGDEYVGIENGFSLAAKPNALDAFHIRGDDGNVRTYVAAVLATSTAQFSLTEVTNVATPTLVATSTLAGVVATGSEPAGWRVMYYNGYVYAITKETAGPELHVFDVRVPTNVREVGTGLSLNITVNDMSAEEGRLYAATSRDSGEIAVFLIENTGALTEVMSMRTDLPGTQDGESIFVAGDRLYLGRASNTAGPELYIYEIKDDELLLLASENIPAVSITGIQVAGGYAYLAATPTGISTRRLDIYDVHDSTVPARVGSRSVPGLMPDGIDVSNGGVYAASVRDAMLRLLPFE